MSVEKPTPKQLLRPITTGAGSAMNQSQFLAITYNSLKAREKSRVHSAIGFGFPSYWLKNWRESFKAITKRKKKIVYSFKRLRCRFGVQVQQENLEASFVLIKV